MKLYQDCKGTSVVLNLLSFRLLDLKSGPKRRLINISETIPQIEETWSKIIVNVLFVIYQCFIKNKTYLHHLKY